MNNGVRVHLPEIKNPYERLAEIAERLGVPPKPLATKTSIYVDTGRGRFDLFDIIEAMIDRIDQPKQTLNVVIKD